MAEAGRSLESAAVRPDCHCWPPTTVTWAPMNSGGGRPIVPAHARSARRALGTGGWCSTLPGKPRGQTWRLREGLRAGERGISGRPGAAQRLFQNE
jgi:hypothetical protein